MCTFKPLPNTVFVAVPTSRTSRHWNLWEWNAWMVSIRVARYRDQVCVPSIVANYAKIGQNWAERKARLELTHVGYLVPGVYSKLP